MVTNARDYKEREEKRINYLKAMIREMSPTIRNELAQSNQHSMAFNDYWQEYIGYTSELGQLERLQNE